MIWWTDSQSCVILIRLACCGHIYFLFCQDIYIPFVVIFVVKICLIAATHPPDVCGVGDYTDQLASALAAEGHEITILTTCRTRPPTHNTHVRVKATVSAWNMSSLHKLRSEIKSEAYDIVHLQYTPGYYGRRTMMINCLPWLLRGLPGCPVFVTFHEIYTPMLPGFRNKLVGLYDRIKDTVLLQGSTAVILTVPNRVHRLTTLFPWLRSRLYYIPVGTGITVVPVTPSEQQTERARFGIHPEEWVIGSFGTLHTDRRYDMLFRAARQLLDEGHRIRVMLIGAYEEDHIYYIQLKKCIADLDLEPYIIWTGFGTSATISRWLALVDIYVMTDIRGASGRKSSLTTALAHGLPIISTRGQDTPSDFVHGSNVLLFDIDDDRELIQHIIQLLHNQETCTRLRTGARTLHALKYAWKSIARSTLQVYWNHYGPGAER